MKSRLAVLVVLAVSALIAGAVPATASNNLYLTSGDNDVNATAMAFSLAADGTPTPIQTYEGTAGGYFNAISMSPDGKFVFMVDYNLNEIRSLGVGVDGKLTELSGSPVLAGGAPFQVAVTPDGKFLYVPNSDSADVSGYALGADGTTTELPGSPYAVTTDAYGGLAISPDGRTLYASGDSYKIEAASIGSDGALTAGPSIIIDDYNPGLALNPAGTRLYNAVMNEETPDNRLLTFSVGASGSLTPFGTPLPLDEKFSPDTDSLVVTPAQPPVASLAVRSGSNREVSFDASDSADSDGPIASYAWNFGDGITATTTTPTTTHSYSKDGNYAATVTLTDADGCSTEMIFTGRTAYCNGSGVAKASATAVADSHVAGVKVSAKKTQRQKRGSKLLIRVKAGAAEAVTLEARGRAKFKGLRGKLVLKRVKRRTGAGKSRTLKLRLKLRAKSKWKARAAARRKGNANIQVRFTDKAGNTVVKKVKVKTVPPRKKRHHKK